MSAVILHSDSGAIRYGWGEKAVYEVFENCNWQELDHFLEKYKTEEKFIFISYDLGKEILPVKKSNTQVNLPLIRIWIPEKFALINQNQVLKSDADFDELSMLISERSEKSSVEFEWKAEKSKAEYLANLSALKEEIQYGNIYEINYCQKIRASFSDDVGILENYKTLYHFNPTPFSFYIENDQFAICSASPERFIQKIGDKIISQPIKGTIRRGKNEQEDESLKRQLVADPKERSENVMIVDLVRNDLSKIAEKNSVKVEELCGVYTYPTVHQLISTISCKVKKDCLFSEILKAMFPMGSMTGAPKISAMNLSEKLEGFTREAYSGSFGYIDSKGDFDLNVIIRSLVFDKVNQEVSCSVGGAITVHSNPEAEYEECRTKVSKIVNLFGSCPI